MSPETIYRKKEGLSVRRLGDEIMLYDGQTDKVHILNETGAILWDLVDGEKRLQEIESIFIKRFPDIRPEDISRDIREIVEKLEIEGLICS